MFFFGLFYCTTLINLSSQCRPERCARLFPLKVDVVDRCVFVWRIPWCSSYFCRKIYTHHFFPHSSFYWSHSSGTNRWPNNNCSSVHLSWEVIWSDLQITVPPAIKYMAMEIQSNPPFKKRCFPSSPSCLWISMDFQYVCAYRRVCFNPPLVVYQGGHSQGPRLTFSWLHQAGCLCKIWRPRRNTRKPSQNWLHLGHVQLKTRDFYGTQRMGGEDSKVWANLRVKIVDLFIGSIHHWFWVSKFQGHATKTYTLLARTKLWSNLVQAILVSVFREWTLDVYNQPSFFGCGLKMFQSVLRG